MSGRPGYYTVVDALRTLVEASAQAVGQQAMPIGVYLASRAVLDDVDAADRAAALVPLGGDADAQFDALLSEIGVMPQRGRR